MNAFIPMNLIR